jgi:hypothetical protein
VYEVFWIWKDILRPGSPYYGRPEFDPDDAAHHGAGRRGRTRSPTRRTLGFLDWDFPGLRTAVHVDGAVNSRTNTDRGWTVELAFPWRGMADLADRRALPPKDGDVWRIDCSRVREDGAERGSAGPVRRMDVESPRALRFAHSGSLPVRNVLGEDGGVGLAREVF